MKTKPMKILDIESGFVSINDKQVCIFLNSDKLLYFEYFKEKLFLKTEEILLLKYNNTFNQETYLYIEDYLITKMEIEFEESDKCYIYMDISSYKYTDKKDFIKLKRKKVINNILNI